MLRVPLSAITIFLENCYCWYAEFSGKSYEYNYDEVMSWTLTDWWDRILSSRRKKLLQLLH